MLASNSIIALEVNLMVPNVKRSYMSMSLM